MMTVEGTVTVSNQLDGNRAQVYDSRTNFPLFVATADSTGRISVRLDPKTVLPPLVHEDRLFYGVVVGSAQTLHFRAHDGRRNAAGSDFLWSNIFSKTVVG